MSTDSKRRASRLVHVLLLSCGLAAGFPLVLAYGDEAAQIVHVTLGDYKYNPDKIALKAGQPAVLELQNVDRITPHNLTLQDGGLDIDVDVSAGKTVRVELTPQIPGSYTFYCNKKLLFMKSHREHGMEGTLTVTP
jgi:plastocyanin